jgi:indolepyruvate ferredoxin oxidoreductase
LFRLMAYKDEYEVARLHVAENYAPGVVFHMSPPLLTRIDQRTGRRNKVAIPGWLALPLFRLLRRGKAVRGTRFDPFGYQAERKAERALIEQYIVDLRTALATLRPETLETAVGLASLPDAIRGFGPVKDNARAKAETRRTELLAALNNAPAVAMAAE